jgi:TnpA family transposase
MPGQFLTQAERERLQSIPKEIPHEDLIAFFTLSADDLALVYKRSGDYNRLGLAVQLGTLRYLGFVPDDINSTPQAVVDYIATQLNVAPSVLRAYGERTQTRTDQLQEVQVYLGFHKADKDDFRTLAAWLLERALEHDRPILLFQLVIEKLASEKIVRPGVTSLERMVVTARSMAGKETFRRLEPLLTPERQVFLDQLLMPSPTLLHTPLTWLRRGATTNSPTAILNALAKLTFLKQQAVNDWDMTRLNPNRIKFLAQLGKKSTNQALQRADAERRYPILIAFCYQIFEEITDEVIDIYDRCLADTYARARRDLEEFRRDVAQSTNEKIRLLLQLGSVILDEDVTDELVRANIYKRVSPEQLLEAIEQCANLLRPADDSYFDFWGNRYSYIRQFAPTFLATFTFYSNSQPDALLEAIALLRHLDAEGRRKVPDSTPMLFVPSKWDSYVIDSQGKIARRYYELCVLWELRSALRAGNIWLEGSRRYANPESYLIPPKQWSTRRPEVCQLLQVPEVGEVRLQQRASELEEQLSQFNQTLKSNKQVRIAAGELVISPLKAEDLPESSKVLQKLISQRLPRVDLTDLLIEVDAMTDFSRHLEHVNGTTSRTYELQTYLYAAILAQACNLGLSTMAQMADLSFDRLLWYTNWYLREDTLRPAITAIVNFQYHQPLSQAWGGGILSSSDGQRFPVSVKNRKAVALPRYFGYGRGLTFYTWTSDQFSQYGTKVTPSTVRDATYVLDEILDNETELPILEHTTDTAGYTELVFAMFDLLGLQFSPRIRDLGDQRLYRLDRNTIYKNLEPLLKGTINTERILSRWDDMLRVVGSLKLGWVTASLFIGKLQSFPQQNALMRAFQEYGRLVKTIFILRYLESEEYRRRISAQLNKGETLHSLRRFLFFAHQGQIRQRHSEELANQASCLNLVTNAVVAWNTVYMAAAIEQLKAEGHQISDTDIAHLSPARYEHINPYGKYQFDVALNLSRQQLRPLRPPRRGTL